MKFLIYGAKGWIGTMIVNMIREMYPNYIIIESDTRVHPQNINMLSSEIQNVDRIICSIGRTSGTLSDGTYVNTIDYCETNLVENIRDNLTAPLLLAKLCLQHNKHMLYIGTGCIFSWDTNINTQRKVTEEEYPDFFGSAYSTIKGQTDSLIREYSNVCNVRIRMPINNENHPRNFITKIAEYKYIHNTNNSMTYLPNMLRVIIELSHHQATGTFNATNPGWSCHSNILEEYAKKIDTNHSYTLVKNSDDLNLKSKRSNNILNTSKLENWCNTHGIILMSMTDAIDHCFLTWKHN
jgi:3,5-epimerase/4-reductase